MFHAVSDGASPDDGGAASLGDGGSLRDGEGQAGSELRRYLQAEGLKLPRELSRRSWVAAILSIASAHVWIALALLAARYLPGGPAAIIAVGFVLILLAQRSLQTLVHHLSHDFLTKRRTVNDRVGNLLVAGFIGMRLQNYRRVHFVHHAENGSTSDPEFIDFSVVRARGGLLRYVLHFVVGGEALALVKKYYAPRPQQAQERQPSPRRSDLSGLLGVAICQVTLVALFWLSGAAYLYLVWLYVAVSWSPMLSRLRFLVEHPGMGDRTVSTRAAWYEVLLFAPYQFNYHFEHHAWPALPAYRLRRAHKYLTGRGYFERHPDYLASSFIGSLVHRPTIR